MFYLFKPRRTARAVLEELITGLETGTIVLERPVPEADPTVRATLAANPPPVSVPLFGSSSGQTVVLRGVPVTRVPLAAPAGAVVGRV